ncbi:MAG: hypothetical protein ABJ242_11920 [Marinomonas sp.]
MNIPMIDLVSAAGLETAAAVLAGASKSSAVQNSAAYDDGVVAVMVYVYDILPQAALM